MLVLTSVSLVWVKVSCQPSTKSPFYLVMDGVRREVSSHSESEGIEPRNNYGVGGQCCSCRGTAELWIDLVRHHWL